MSDATFYAWKKTYAHPGGSELRRLRQLGEESSRLKLLVADLSHDTHRLSEALRKKILGSYAAEHWPPGFAKRLRDTTTDIASILQESRTVSLNIKTVLAALYRQMNQKDDG